MTAHAFGPPAPARGDWVNVTVPESEGMDICLVHYELPLSVGGHAPPAMVNAFGVWLGQAIPALTPVASGPRLRVEVREVRRVGDQVKVSGAVTNISSAPLEIGVRAFAFRDSAGVTYAASGAGTTLQPGQSTALDLAVPLPAGRGLTLLVALPPDPPLEQVLVVETKP